MNYELVPSSVLKLLLAIIAVLLLGNTISWGIWVFAPPDYASGLVLLLNFDRENGLPAFYSATALLLSALLALAISSRHRQAGERWLAWYLLGLMFIFLSIDELMMVHEQLMSPMRAMFDARGVFRWPWVIPYGLAVIVVGCLYLPFLLALPPRTRWLFIASGSIFVGGAVGMEMVGGRYVDSFGVRNVGYAVISTVEESMEKVGVALFIYALLEYLTRQFGPITMILDAGRAGGPTSKPQTLA